MTDELWGAAGTVDPGPPRRFRYPARNRVSDRVALEGSLNLV
jgi:hypothetical protein